MRDNNSPSIPIHKRTQLTPPELSGHDEFLASPFLKPASSPFISSPLSSINNPLFQQLIKEQTSDNEDINDIDEIDELEEMEVANDDNIDLMADHDEEFLQTPSTLWRVSTLIRLLIHLVRVCVRLRLSKKRCLTHRTILEFPVVGRILYHKRKGLVLKRTGINHSMTSPSRFQTR